MCLVVRAKDLDKYIGYHVAIEDANDFYREGRVEEFLYLPERTREAYNDYNGEVEIMHTPAIIKLKFEYQDDIVIIENIPVRVYLNL